MKSLLVIAGFLAMAKANPAFVYTVGQSPYVFTNGHTVVHNEPVQPLQYVRPTLYANNACRNNLGELVPCAFPSLAGSAVYAYNTVPDYGFLQAASGLAAPVAEAKTMDDDEEVPEAPIAPAVLDLRSNGLEKREAEADPEAHSVVYAYPYYGYYGAYNWPYYTGYHPYGCRNGYGSIVPCA